MIHYVIELALWTAGMFLIGCPLGAAARAVFAARGRRRGGGPSGAA